MLENLKKGFLTFSGGIIMEHRAKMGKSSNALFGGAD